MIKLDIKTTVFFYWC